ncbi:hypothetical protein M011DRAFT_398799 [Sporormia fimetaria CBS 119925]|uniref:Glycerate dehydrogenase n=1 Tax=Sporormia fimetaria CBS 119925 TaxID=1340428 RepID=A0A6A6VFM7_9PLEO|nr:hypothetical protein M011DRAFT_398799 [Sporormia fimetaria CBS 119925]
MHYIIVDLDAVNQPPTPTFNFPPGITYDLIKYQHTLPDEVPSRLSEATIVISTTVRLDASVLSASATPNLVLVAVMATGTDIVDLSAARSRGLRVVNCPAANLDAVSEHAISLYFAARRRTVMLDKMTKMVPSPWAERKSLTSFLRYADGKPPLTCGEEVVGILGYGGLGKRIARLAKGLGMKVLVAKRKGADDGNDTTAGATATSENDVERVSFTQVLRQSTVLVLSLPRDPSTLNLLSTEEFTQMSPYAVVVNIARGGIVDEKAVVEALKGGQIAGYATDVFDKEPPEGAEDSPLLGEEARDLNITVSPHLAWFTQKTLNNLAAILKGTVEAWVEGKPMNIVV